MKKLNTRTLQPLALSIPSVRIGTETPQPLPMRPVNDFLQKCAQLESEGVREKKARTYLICDRYRECFGTLPPVGLSVEVCKARVAARLQYEGFRIAGATPSEKFLQNYNALMRFDDSHPYEGCTDQVAWVGKRLALEAKEISMSTTQKIISQDKKLASAAKTKSAKTKSTASPSTREMVFDTYSPVGVIRWLIEQHVETRDEIMGILNTLKVTNIAPSTIQTTLSDQRSEKYRRPIPEIAKEHTAALKALIQASKKTIHNAEIAQKAIEKAEAKKLPPKKLPPKKLPVAAPPAKK